MALIRQRKLSKQQLRRIQKQNKQGENNAVLDETLLNGVVMAHYGKQLEVQVTSLPKTMPVKPEIKADEPEPFWQPIKMDDIWRCHARTNLTMIAAGDRVTWTADPNTGLGRIESIKPRHSLINRPDRYHKLKPVVANTDVLAIVFAPMPIPAPSLIDRYLVVAHHANVKPLLVLNKADLLTENEFSDVTKLLEDYQKLGYDTVLTAAPKRKEDSSNPNEDPQGLDSLEAYIDGKQVVFAGQSGVGKSSLINALLPESEQSVNVISANSGLGQHTTTTSRFLPFEPSNLNKGGIVDTPGIREYGIWHLQPEDIINGFVELEPLAGYCKFRDCKHTSKTKGCALQEAVAKGEVLARRVDNLITLQEEADTPSYK